MKERFRMTISLMVCVFLGNSMLSAGAGIDRSRDLSAAFHFAALTRLAQARHPKRKHKATPTPDDESGDQKPAASSTPQPTVEQITEGKKEAGPPAVTSLSPADLKSFDSQSDRVKTLIQNALELTTKNLTYLYGSGDPEGGGMDCSGFIYYVLKKSGFNDVPRQSSDQYIWLRKASDFHAVLSRRSDTFELEDLRPGDLMFWSGTYKVERDVPITHVMIYLGPEKKTGRPVMVGASDGRTYNGERRSGVSVFDFKMPSGAPNKSDPDLVARFEGYASLPGVRATTRPAANSPAPTQHQSTPSPASTPTPKSATPTPRKTAVYSNGD